MAVRANQRPGHETAPRPVFLHLPRPFRVKLRNTRNEQIFSALPPIADILGGRLARLSSGGRGPIFRKCPLASALPAPELTRVFAISLPVGNWIVFYSFVIDHEIPFAYERPLCARSGRSISLMMRQRRAIILRPHQRE